MTWVARARRMCSVEEKLPSITQESAETRSAQRASKSTLESCTQPEVQKTWSRWTVGRESRAEICLASVDLPLPGLPRTRMR